MPNIREKVLQLYESHREEPGAPYDESHFLDFLLADGATKSVYNSFKGLRRFNAFWDEVQYEYAIFFSIKDRDANYSLERFVQRVEELIEKPSSSLASLRKPMKGYVEGIVVVGPLLFWIPALALLNHIVIAAALFSCGAVLLLYFFLIYRRERMYLKRLHQKIKMAQQGRPTRHSSGTR
ncbi:hypothetical protein IVG45_02915 [Methylomonas sp. LL1]|uniref:hypothetical protein n=1 Tax=Methylomonas sp. LL1 TaxID=2785785 RepID=UPI0018C394EB|nr:hypothetical protein [Methylomonas sp. LL1]QPK63947.1 hypothetical protein IVG45_02915 [Methylomonas sp. LL1]